MLGCTKGLLISYGFLTDLYLFKDPIKIPIMPFTRETHVMMK